VQGNETQEIRPATTAWSEFRALLALGGPIALAQLGMTSLNFVDILWLGHYRADALSAMALGNNLVWAAMVFCMGVVTVVDPLLSQAVGARDGDAITRAKLRGLVLSLLLAAPAGLLLLPAAPILAFFGQPPELVPDAATYARINVLGILPLLWFHVLRTFLSAHGRVRAQLVVIVGGNILNAFVDWLWIFGNWGFTEMGVAGAAWATVAVRWVMCFMLFAVAWREAAPHLVRMGDATMRGQALDPRVLWRMVRAGSPIGAQYALEMGIFALTMLLVGWSGSAALGGHQVTLQLASMSFMVPLGISMAASVRIGWAVGRGDHESARRSARVAMAAGVLVMCGFAVLYTTVPGALGRMFTDDPGILGWTVLLLPIAGVFQVVDGAQVVAIGCLRGLGDTRSPFLANLAGYWVLGLPLGIWLWDLMDRDPQGLWWGLALGLGFVAAFLVLLLYRRLAEGRTRMRVD